MKILFILHETSVHNGSWRSAFRLLLGLRTKGVELLVICPGKKGVYNILMQYGFNVEAVKCFWNKRSIHPSLREQIEYYPRAIRRFFYKKLWIKRCSDICRSFKPDIIHSNSSVITNGFYIARKFKIPHVWHIREYGEQDFQISLKESDDKFKLNEYFICITDSVKKYRGLENKENAKVIYNGIITEQNISESINEDKEKNFLYVGSLNEGKGIKDLLVAWKNACNDENLRGFKLLVCGGNPDDISHWKKFCLSEAISNIDWLGQRDDVFKLMKRAYAVIVPSFFEAFGRVMPEAMSNGALVIGRNTAGTKEQFDNGLKLTGREIGLRFENIGELSHQIIEVAINKPSYYSEMIEAGRRTVQALYTMDSNTNRVFEFYQTILSTNKD